MNDWMSQKQFTHTYRNICVYFDAVFLGVLIAIDKCNFDATIQLMALD